MGLSRTDFDQAAFSFGVGPSQALPLAIRHRSATAGRVGMAVIRFSELGLLPADVVSSERVVTPLAGFAVWSKRTSSKM
jgi:hypothetical protein